MDADERLAVARPCGADSELLLAARRGAGGESLGAEDRVGDRGESVGARRLPGEPDLRRQLRGKGLDADGMEAGFQVHRRIDGIGAAVGVADEAPPLHLHLRPAVAHQTKDVCPALSNLQRGRKVQHIPGGVRLVPRMEEIALVAVDVETLDRPIDVGRLARGEWQEVVEGLADPVELEPNAGFESFRGLGARRRGANDQDNQHDEQAGGSRHGRHEARQLGEETGVGKR